MRSAKLAWIASVFGFGVLFGLIPSVLMNAGWFIYEYYAFGAGGFPPKFWIWGVANAVFPAVSIHFVASGRFNQFVMMSSVLTWIAITVLPFDEVGSAVKLEYNWVLLQSMLFFYVIFVWLCSFFINTTNTKDMVSD